MFTLFFAGREYAPKAIINGVNIQDFLEGHYLNALRHLAQRIHDARNLESHVHPAPSEDNLSICISMYASRRGCKNQRRGIRLDSIRPQKDWLKSN